MHTSIPALIALVATATAAPIAEPQLEVAGIPLDTSLELGKRCVPVTVNLNAEGSVGLGKRDAIQKRQISCVPIILDAGVGLGKRQGGGLFNPAVSASVGKGGVRVGLGTRDRLDAPVDVDKRQIAGVPIDVDTGVDLALRKRQSEGFPLADVSVDVGLGKRDGLDVEKRQGSSFAPGINLDVGLNV
jgi:hypothetical protein